MRARALDVDALTGGAEPAPLPSYQRQYSGDRYPQAEQQQSLQSRNYRYQPQDAVVQQHYQAQRGSPPPHQQAAPTSHPQSAPPSQREQKAPKSQGADRGAHGQDSGPHGNGSDQERKQGQGQGQGKGHDKD